MCVGLGRPIIPTTTKQTKDAHVIVTQPIKQPQSLPLYFLPPPKPYHTCRNPRVPSTNAFPLAYPPLSAAAAWDGSSVAVRKPSSGSTRMPGLQCARSKAKKAWAVACCDCGFWGLTGGGVCVFSMIRDRF